MKRISIFSLLFILFISVFVKTSFGQEFINDAGDTNQYKSFQYSDNKCVLIIPDTLTNNVFDEADSLLNNLDIKKNELQLFDINARDLSNDINKSREEIIENE